ncbi:hypothetical protein [Chitinophaga rhizosphaerae]|uniref:hypothetical protein n=1 Tax=Chitinophaga rhizosphaerae TaxID=1864947 RepID=UPI000F806931|nr:hypothetical protein [Chitinophaga rhizosphaerae]
MAKPTTAIVASIAEPTVLFLIDAFCKDGRTDRICISTAYDITKQSGLNHLFELWIQKGTRAAKALDDQENAFIAELKALDAMFPKIIFTHPSIWANPSWREYVIETKPYLLYITQTSREAYYQLRRYHNELKNLLNPRHQYYGMWYNGLITRRVEKGYILDETTIAKNNVRDAIQRLELNLRLSSNGPIQSLLFSSVKKDPVMLEGTILNVYSRIGLTIF